jgi:hypothetical protein
MEVSMSIASLENAQKRYHEFVVGLMPFNNPEESPMLPYTRPIPREEAVDRFLRKNQDCRNFRRELIGMFENMHPFTFDKELWSKTA